MGNMLFVATISWLVLSFMCAHVNAQSRVDEEIRLSKLAVSAFECSIVAPDQTESQRLFDIGFAAGQKFLDGLSNVKNEEEEEKRLKENIAILWIGKGVAGRTHDFVLGQVYSEIEAYIYKDFLDDKNSWTLKEDQMFAHKNCILIR
jgi:hypothetical protein